MAFSTRLGKCVNGGVILILVLGFELLQLSRLHSHCTDEETETQTIERSCLRPPGQSLGTLTPGLVLSFLCTHFLPCLCGSGPASRNSPWLQAHAGDGQPPGGLPGARLKFLQWTAARVDVLCLFLASQKEEGLNLCTCLLWGPGTGGWPSATGLFGVWIGGT